MRRWKSGSLLAAVAAATLPAQDEPELTRCRQELARARQRLASPQLEARLAAVRAMVAVTSDAVLAGKAGVDRALATALSDGDAQVVSAAVQGLISKPIASNGVPRLVEHFEKLVAKLHGARTPTWPLPRLPEFELPPMPPIGGSAAAKREYERKLRTYRVKQRAAIARAKRQAAEDQRKRKRAKADKAALDEIVAAVNGFAPHLGTVKDDRAVDVLLRAFDEVMKKASASSAVIVAALCATERRDAVERCVERFTNAHLVKLVLGELIREALGKTRRADPLVAGIKDLVSRIWARLLQVGERHGVAAPELSLGENAPMAWEAWWKALRPKLPETLGRIQG